MRAMKPSSNPMPTSRTMTPTIVSISMFAMENGSSRGPRRMPMMAARATRSITGKLTAEKKGRTSRKAPARRNTSMQLYICSSMAGRAARSLDHLRHLLDDCDGELDERAHDPRQQEQEDARH